MKTRKALIILGIIALALAIAVITMQTYYVVIAILAGGIILAHRELWSLIRTGHLPPLDERVKENNSLAIRNGFIFMVLALIALMLVYSIRFRVKPDLLPILAGLFIATVIVYLFSYLFYDRVQPGLTVRKKSLMMTFLKVMGASVPFFIVCVFLHNLLSALLSVEEPVFFILAVIVSPLAFAAGIIGILIIFILSMIPQRLE